MKTKELVVCLVVLLFGVSAVTAAKEIPGGILYGDGKDAIYQDFSTGEKVNLTPDFEPPVTGAVTISEDRTLLAFASNDKVFVKQLPNGTPFQIDIGNAKRLSFSPDGLFLSYEASQEVRVVPIRKVYYRNNWEIKPEEKTFSDSGFPVWKKEAPLLTKEVADRVLTRIQEKLLQEILKRGTVLGNRTLSVPQRIRIVGLLNQPFEVFVGTGGWQYKGGLLAKYNELYRRDTDEGVIDTDTARQKGISLTVPAYMWRIREIAIIEPTSEKQELIFLRRGEKTIYIEHLQERGRWENLHSKIKLRGDCQRLAVRPDGTVTYLSGTTVYSKSGEIIAEGIEGSSLQWVTNSSFLFRGDDGSLCFWENGKVKKILDDVPEEFCYTPASLSATSGTFTVPWEGEFYFGKLRFVWTYIYPNIRPHRTYFPKGKPPYDVPSPADKLKIWLELPPGIEYAIVDNDDVNKIIDPSGYTYLMSSKEIDFRSRRIDFPIIKTLVIKQGNEIIALRIVEAGFSPVQVSNYYHELGIRTEPKGRTFISFYILPSAHPQLTFEWRYWQE